MFLSASEGGGGLWELAHWNEAEPNFLIENAKGELVGRFQIIKDKRGQYAILRLDPSSAPEDSIPTNSPSSAAGNTKPLPAIN